MSSKVAIIDLGTNTFHLLVAEMKMPPNIVFRDRAAVKVGQGGINSGFITPQASARALAALKAFRNEIDKRGVDLVLTFGTSALRNARNREEFISEIRRETGFDIRTIDGDEEATLIFEGVRGALKLGEPKSLIVDVGGGSVEFIIGNEHEIHWKKSFEVGGQRLLERFHRNDPILPTQISELNKYLEGTLQSLFEQLAIHKPQTLVGVSGTFDTLSEIYCYKEGLPYHEHEPETPLTISSFYDTTAQLVKKSRAERMAIPGMIEMRVDMIVAACCLIKLVMDKYPMERIRVSTWSLKEGALIRFLSSQR
jgi:exopolyphosphatase/guanosine-5'-triphosphate,3'-diphosphate pyrophosphatase